ncbi:MAG: aminotransferase class V-fold PLP-dependent enzyme [Candidatus Nanohalobium sp.]
MKREDFPPLKNKELTYLDSSCMSLRPQQVINAVKEYYTEYPACPGRSHHSMSEKATQKIEETRQKTAEFIGTKKNNLILNTGTTKGLNTVAKTFPAEKVFISDREHNSGLVPFQEKNCKLQILDTEGGLNLEKLDSEISEGDLLSLVHVSNLDGKKLDVKEAAKVARENNAYTMIDGAQSIPHNSVDVSSFPVDFLAFSGHKMLGPSGTGALYVSDRGKQKIKPLTTGGEAVENTTYQEAEYSEFPHRYEAGLPNVAGLIGMGAAVDYLENIGMEKIHRHEKKLTQKLEEELKGLEDVRYVSKGSGVVSFWIKGMDSHQAALMLDEEDIAVRSGMHCVHSWFNDREERPGVRASLYLYNNEKDVEKLANELEKLVYIS